MGGELADALETICHLLTDTNSTLCVSAHYLLTGIHLGRLLLKILGR